MKKTKDITIKDIAREAKVSVATVSRVLNNPQKVSKKTYNKVRKVIKKLGYQPNIAARSLITGRTNIIVLVVPPEQTFISAYYFYRLLTGISEQATELGYHILVKPHFSSDKTYISELLNLQCDGYIVIAPLTDDIFVKHLEVSGNPAVLINSRSLYLNWVDLDNINAGFLLTEHLINLGHKKIIFLGGFMNSLNTQDRLKGYQLALSKHEIVYFPDLVFYARYDQDTAYKIIKDAILTNKDFSSIFSCNDLMAIGAIQAIKDCGMKVPEDIAVVGFDDIDIAASFIPSITTVRQPFIEMGKKAVEILVNQIENKETKLQNIEFSGELVIRESSGVSLAKKHNKTI